jgi:hypothetical protein
MKKRYFNVKNIDFYAFVLACARAKLRSLRSEEMSE